MDRKNLIFYLPFYYSIRSRGFRNYISNTFFLSIWIMILYNSLNNSWFDLSIYQNYLIYLITFLLIYEIGYIFNDTLSVKKENIKISRIVHDYDVKSLNLFFGMILRALSIIVLIIINNEIFHNLILGIYLATFLIFMLHNSLKETSRWVTFFLLRNLKIIAPLYFLIMKANYEFKSFTVVTAIVLSGYYTYFYFLRKNYKIHTRFLSNKIVKSELLKIIFVLLFNLIIAYLFNYLFKALFMKMIIYFVIYEILIILIRKFRF